MYLDILDKFAESYNSFRKPFSVSPSPAAYGICRAKRHNTTKSKKMGNKK